MGLKNAEYWRVRFEEIEREARKTAEKTANDLEKEFRKSQITIEKEIEIWYNRLAKNNGVSMLEAKKLLNKAELKEFRWSVEDYIRHGEENALNQRWIKELENASAKVHITRLEQISTNIKAITENLYAGVETKTENCAEKVYRDVLGKTVYKIQVGTNIGGPTNLIDAGRLNNIVKGAWTADGRTFSDRIWKDKQGLLSELETGLVQNTILGGSSDELAPSIARKFRTKLSNAQRIVYTESAYFASKAELDGYKELGVEQYEILATLDRKTSEICREMDGKVFDVKDFRAGVTAPPFHPNCRTTTVPYFGDEDDFGGERFARGEDGKAYYVPASMKYEEWEKIFRNGMVPVLTKIPKRSIMMSGKQFGKKIGKHASDFGLNPSEEDDRQKMNVIIEDIFNNYDEVRTGNWKGQNTEVLFYVKGNDVVVTKPNGEFITILKGGVENARVKNARNA